ncbi:MAG: hypothetical protein AB7I19_03175 [Planctomycetota bacterium]
MGRSKLDSPASTFSQVRSKTSKLSSLLGALTLSGGLLAQTFHTSPSEYANAEGNTNNTIPWWSLSATYQQIHDAPDLAVAFGSPIAVITSLNFRKDGGLSSSIAGRSIDAQITLGTTTISALTATTDFATNLGPSPQVGLAYTTVSLPGLSNSSLPNPIGWSLPLTTPYVYASPTGNLCWELRFTNGSGSANAAMDAVSRSNSVNNGLLGAGCAATGQSNAATIGARSLSMTTGAWRNRLDNAAASSIAVQLIGFGAQQILLPGFCSNLEFLPVASAQSMTSATGQWDSTLTFGDLRDGPGLDILAQFAFLDAGLPGGVGLSNASSFSITPTSVRDITRIYAAPSQGGLGNELATNGTVGLRYGLVTIFGQ